MTLLMGLSLASFRRSDFEMFFTLHIILVPLTLTFSSLHYPPLGPFCWSALGLWASERAWRLYKASRLNDGIHTDAKLPPLISTDLNGHPFDSTSLGIKRAVAPDPEIAYNFHSRNSSGDETSHGPHARSLSGSTLSQVEPIIGSKFEDSAEISGSTIKAVEPGPQTRAASRTDSSSKSIRTDTPSSHSVVPNDSRRDHHIPPGCGRAVLLPGRSIRLTVRTPRPLEGCAAGAVCNAYYPSAVLVDKSSLHCRLHQRGRGTRGHHPGTEERSNPLLPTLRVRHPCSSGFNTRPVEPSSPIRSSRFHVLHNHRRPPSPSSTC